MNSIDWSHWGNIAGIVLFFLCCGVVLHFEGKRATARYHKRRKQQPLKPPANRVTFDPFEVAELERDPETLRKVADLNDGWEENSTAWGTPTTARAQELRLEAIRRAGL